MYSRIGGMADVPYDALDNSIPSSGAVRLLATGEFEAFESGQDGTCHAYPESTLLFHGEHEAKWRALGLAQTVRLLQHRSIWPILDQLGS